MEQQQVDSFARLFFYFADKFGIAGAVLSVLAVFFAFVFWRVTVWTAPRADDFIKAQINLMKTASEMLPQISDAAKATSKSVSVLAESQASEREAMKHLSKAIDEAANPQRRSAVRMHTDNMRESLE